MANDLYAADGNAGLSSVLPGLQATPAAPLPYVKNGVVRSFVLEREQGNIVIYNAPGVTAAAAEILALGTPDRLLMNHWHEEMYGAPKLDVPMFIHERDRAAVDGTIPIAGTFTGRAMIGDDLDLIPTPGHTAGTTTFLWRTADHRVLFPGDWVTVEQGEWKAVVLGESDRDDYLASLALLMDLEFDYLVPWGNVAGQPYGFEVTRAEARAQLGRIAERLRAGKYR